MDSIEFTISSFIGIKAVGIYGETLAAVTFMVVVTLLIWRKRS